MYINCVYIYIYIYQYVLNVKFSSTRPTSRVNLLSLECEPDINNHNTYILLLVEYIYIYE
jgi:hypothetical protein